MWWGRTFELQDGTIVLPCNYCGNPVFEPDRHSCPGLLEVELQKMEDL